MKKQANPILLLIDGNNLAYRCRHVFNLTHKGMDVSVTYGFLRTMNSMIAKFRPYAVLVAWDGGVPEFRKTLLPQYKANRHLDEDEVAREDFRRQMSELTNIALPSMGVLSVRLWGVEADDILYHASRISAPHVHNVIVTGDKDILQAIDDKTTVYSPHHAVMYDSKAIEAEFGIPLQSYVHWKAIQGDSSDNIPGVPGIGAKTATKLFQQFGTLTGITNAAMGINPNGKITDKLATNILGFGLDRITLNIRIMVLFRDELGIRIGLLRAADKYITCSKTMAKNYILYNGFTSLVEMPGAMSKLVCPEFRDDERYPINVARRMPV